MANSLEDSALRKVIAYTVRVEGFGQRLRAVRDRMKATAIARRGMGPEATQKEVRNFANYISRLEREDPSVRNPSLDVLERLARGFGLSLSQFFQKIENDNQKMTLHGTDEFAKNASNFPLHREAAHHGGRSVSSAAISDEDFLLFVEILQSALGGSILDAIRQAQTHRRPPGPRARKTRHRKGA